jgi:S-adenosylmethionine:tRNA ribosyltransferase-isomerase
MHLEDLDFGLPEGLVAQYPAEQRDESRLFVLDRAGSPDRHLLFRQLPELLRPGDVLVLNQTRVVPARLRGRKRRTGGRVELLLLRRETAEGEWLAMARPLRGLGAGDQIDLDRGDAKIEVVERVGDRVRVRVPVPPRDDDPTGFKSLQPLAEVAGEVPLPPYIRRATEAPDLDRYQTVFAVDPGSIAAPTAGLHFTEALLTEVRAKGVGVVSLTLHVGPGTFEPIRAADPRDHRVEAEYYELPEEAVAHIERRRAAGGRVIAVGTTAVRVLESCWDGGLRAGEGWTDLVIHPPHPFGAVDAMITNFHLPRSSLLMLVRAFAGDRLLAAYADAVREGYRFYSYGDAMFIT